jgi:hypothetical protein
MIDLTTAVASARAYVRDHKLDVSKAYLQGAVFDASARRWVVNWQVPSVKGGLTIVFIPESGNVTVDYGE